MPKISEICKSLELKVLSSEQNIEREFSGVYISDLLSWVMSHANKDNIWITVLTNINVAAVALLTEVACVIIPEAINVEENTIKKAEEHGIIILSSSMPGAELCSKLLSLK